MRDLLQRMLECLYLIQYCRDPATATLHIGYHPVDAMVGELDWIAEYRYLIKEIPEWPKPISEAEKRDGRLTVDKLAVIITEHSSPVINIGT